MADSVAAFQGWNSSIQGWDTGTWNTNVAFPLTATAAVNSAAPNIEGDAFGQAGAVVGTAAVGAVTVVGEANVSVTGVAGTAALGSFFTTNTEVQMTSAVGTTTITGHANVEVTGFSVTGQIGTLRSIWGNIIPSQTSNFLNITVSQEADWTQIEHGRAA
tara:strand:+ start:127 stop:606 length:480 start_codon:yes stop_codon:yes gene_type:complete